MKISHIIATAKQTDGLGHIINDYPILTHFLHLENRLINVLEIVSVSFNDSNCFIFTTDGTSHVVSSKKDQEELKKFFQVE